METFTNEECILYKLGVLWELLPFLCPWYKWKCILRRFSKSTNFIYEQNKTVFANLGKQTQGEYILIYNRNEFDHTYFDYLKNHHVLEDLKIVINIKNMKTLYHVDKFKLFLDYWIEKNYTPKFHEIQFSKEFRKSNIYSEIFESMHTLGEDCVEKLVESNDIKRRILVSGFGTVAYDVQGAKSILEISEWSTASVLQIVESEVLFAFHPLDRFLSKCIHINLLNNTQIDNFKQLFRVDNDLGNDSILNNVEHLKFTIISNADGWRYYEAVHSLVQACPNLRTISFLSDSLYAF